MLSHIFIEFFTEIAYGDLLAVKPKCGRRTGTSTMSCLNANEIHQKQCPATSSVRNASNQLPKKTQSWISPMKAALMGQDILPASSLANKIQPSPSTSKTALRFMSENSRTSVTGYQATDS